MLLSFLHEAPYNRTVRSDWVILSTSSSRRLSCDHLSHGKIMLSKISRLFLYVVGTPYCTPYSVKSGRYSVDYGQAAIACCSCFLIEGFVASRRRSGATPGWWFTHVHDEDAGLLRTSHALLRFSGVNSGGDSSEPYVISAILSPTSAPLKDELW